MGKELAGDTTESPLPAQQSIDLGNVTRAEWVPHYFPSQGWAGCWIHEGEFIPIFHMRWTDCTRPQIEARVESEVRLICKTVNNYLRRHRQGSGLT